MNYITLTSGDKMPQVGFGTWTLKGDECRESVEMALEEGYIHIDTAEGYKNHQEVARAIKNVGVSREDLFITSKVGSGHLKYEDTIKAGEETLRDLDTDYVDLFLIHWPRFIDVSMEETFKAMAELKRSGKIRNVGVSNFTVNHLRDALAVTDVPITVNQVEFHPFLYQKDLLDFCNENKIALTAHTPIAQGTIYEDEELKRIAGDHEKGLARVVLKWLADKGITVIPRSTKREHIRDNKDLFDWNLSQEISEAIDNIKKEHRFAKPDHFDPDYQPKHV
ncbi:MAG: aldo/keto reductase [Spirochaetia bacterium]